MITDSSIEIDAPAATVWDVFVDVERWSEWTASIDRIVALDGPGIEVGRRFEIKQPRLPAAGVGGDRGRARRVLDLAAAVARRHHAGHARGHRPQDGGRTLVRQRIDQRGPIGVTVGALMRRLTRRYLDLEGHGLKATSEQRCRDASTA